MSEESEHDSKIGPATWLPVAWVAGICVTLLGVKSWLDSQFDAVRVQVLQMQVDLREIRALSQDRWTNSDMALWAERLGRTNPTLQVPPTDVGTRR